MQISQEHRYALSFMRKNALRTGTYKHIYSTKLHPVKQLLSRLLESNF